ncbi:3-deoxy-D-manno-octulosonic acid transferase [Niabella soli]|uniref:3-deoxy-D-manno-octulosonic acid transferase n=1 Tax=Niabella soli TaxID=446683 RepID=UPI0002F17BA6|nr:glycosyltransferase N-terminal domain-containing protein [Niabella soli]
MTVLLYTIFIRLYRAGIGIAALFNPKAKLWTAGRKNILSRLQADFAGNAAKVIWMHCASLGEFEQGRTVLEALKQKYQDHKILLTFFSPSGFEVRKNYPAADWVYYLPLDTRYNAATFIKTVRPALAIFVKYEYWYHFLKNLNREKIPVLLISAIFRADAIFFKPQGAFHRKMLHFFNHIFVQNAESKERLRAIIGENKITVAGDTRFDRVTQIAAGFEPIPLIESFIAPGKFVIVAGSTWVDDEYNLSYFNKLDNNDSILIIAPHEIDPAHIKRVKGLFPGSVLFSELKGTSYLKSTILIIDNIGMLSRLYYYATITYIGGGFNPSGIHNTLEAAVFSKPVLFGPNYQKFLEAIELIKKEGAISYYDDKELFIEIEKLKTQPGLLNRYSTNAGTFVKERTGATGIICNYIQLNFR